VNERDIFHAAVELTDAAARSAYLEEACAGNAALKRHVEDMLQVYPGLGAFLEAPAIDLEGAARTPLRAGRFQLDQELARGGMGVIYSARDESLGRDVAVKVLHERYRSDAPMAQRFLDEARITAQLQHPGIPPVFEVGRLDDGRPYLAMKLIKGRTLEDLLKERSEPAGDHGRFLAVFEQICQAVGYAHSKHVLHRDLKPANVMVGAFGEVQVMDWGVAKLLAPGGDAAHEPAASTEVACGTVIQTSRPGDSGTVTGCAVGTPSFMAPEQADGVLDRLDERTDVFGLGAILCVILTGEPPYTAESGEEVRAMASRGALADAHARLEQCGADAKLVELCRGCLSARQEGRPRDAGAVAATIHGYLAGVEERARQAETKRAEAVVREAEQRKRRRTVQAAGGVITVVLLAGLGVSLWQMFRAQGAEGQASENAQQAREERDAKDEALKGERQARADETKARERAFAALRSMTTDVVEKKFTEGAVLSDADRLFLRGIIAQFDAFAAIQGDDAGTRAVRAEGRLRVGAMRHRLGELKEAERDYDQALSIYGQLSVQFPSEPEFRRELANSLNNRGILLKITGRLKEAEKDYVQALSIRKQLVDELPSRPELRHELARNHLNRGALLDTARRLTEAKNDHDQALSIQKQLAAQFPARPEFRQELASSHNNRGNLLRVMGRPKEAEEDYVQALSIYKQLAAKFPARPEFPQDLAGTHNNRGFLLRGMGRLAEAENDYDQALGIQKDLAARFPARPEYRQELARSHNNRGVLLRATGRLPEAEKDYVQALSIGKQLADDFPARPEFRQELATSQINRGNMLSAAGRVQEAEKDYDQALSIRKQLADDFPARPEFREELASSHNSRGVLLSGTGRPREAEEDYAQALSIYKELSAQFPDRCELRQDLASTYSNRGLLRSGTGRRKEAETDYEQALSIQKQLADEVPSRPEFRQALAISHTNRGLLLSGTGRPKEAETDLNQALSICKQLVHELPSRPELRQKLARSHFNRGNLLHSTRRPKEAKSDYDQALSIQKQLVADTPFHPEFRQDLAASHSNRGNLLRAAGRPEEAEADYSQALSAYKQLAAQFPFRPEYRQKLAQSHFNRGALLDTTRRPKEAKNDYDQAQSIQKQLAAQFPSRPEFRQDLAASHTYRGNLLRATGRPQEAETYYKQALSIQKELAARFPNDPDLRNKFAGTCVSLAFLQQQQGNLAAAKQLLLEARPHHLAALKANPRHPTYQQLYRNHLNGLTRVHAALLEQEDAVRTAESCRDLGWNAPADAYDAACFLSLCIPIVARHSKLDDKKRREAGQLYCDAAMKLLRDAVSKGFKDVVHMKKDTDLNPLHQREDFQKLVAELERMGGRPEQ
jgi:serine/threonine protein kinase